MSGAALTAKRRCRATAERVDGPVPDTCRYQLEVGHKELHLCEHGFRFATTSTPLSALRKLPKLTPGVTKERLVRSVQQSMNAEGYPVPEVVVQRALEKQISRNADAEALRSGDKTTSDLRAENGSFGFPDARVVLRGKRVPK